MQCSGQYYSNACTLQHATLSALKNLEPFRASKVYMERIGRPPLKLWLKLFNGRRGVVGGEWQSRNLKLCIGDRTKYLGGIPHNRFNGSNHGGPNLIDYTKLIIYEIKYLSIEFL